MGCTGLLHKRECPSGCRLPTAKQLQPTCDCPVQELVDQTARAVLLFSSASCFADILGTRGRDVTLMLQGLGQGGGGLEQLFRRMQKLAWGTAAFRVASAIAPQTLRIPVVRHAWDWAWAHIWALWGWLQHVLPGPLAGLMG